ncbi:MAG: ABC transporter permease [candidate division Zixibacteria bacterium]|nr:ABC transporter permease [candidate division Zixibacteria bacterium]
MRFGAIFIKEAILITRDKRALFLTVMFPVFMLLLYSYGVTFDIKNVPVAVLDYSHSATARELIHKVNATGYLEVKYNVTNYDKIHELLTNSRITLAFIIPTDFEKNIKTGQKTNIQVIANGSDANTANVALGYQAAILSSFGAELVKTKLIQNGMLATAVPQVRERTRIWYNPEMKSTFFVAPGVIAVVVMLLGSLLTATSIVREKESGTIEMLISTPIHPFELVMGKIAPYIIIAFIDVLIVILVASFGLGVPVKGDLLLLLGGSFLYLLCALGIGLLASAVTATITSAQLIVTFTGLLPSILLSGFIFPVESMPKFVQFLTYVVPAKYFIIILRGIFLKGIGLSVLWPQFLFLAIFGTLMMLLPASKFKKRID